MFKGRIIRMVILLVLIKAKVIFVNFTCLCGATFGSQLKLPILTPTYMHHERKHIINKIAYVFNVKWGLT